MELFSIICTTCKSRLKVREQAAIGQILACPKCGGMVMVKPPPNWSDARGSKAELPTATEIVGSAPRPSAPLASSAFDAVDDLLSDAPPKVPGSSVVLPPSPAQPAPRRDSPPIPAKPRFQGAPVVPPPLPTAPTKPLLSEGTSASKVNQAPAPSASDATKLAPPPPAETEAAPELSPAAPPSRMRFWLVTAGSTAVGIVLAFVAVTVAIQFFRGSLPTPARNKGTQIARASKPALSTSEPPQPSSSAPAPEAITPQVAAAAPNPPPAEPAKSTEPPVAAATPPQPAGDPLGMVKEPATPPPATPAAATPNSAAASAADPLARFDSLIGGAAEDPLAKASPPPNSAAPAVPSDTTPNRPIAPRPPPRDVDVARRLADPLLGIESTSTPLADFLQSLADLSTIPISLELDALPLVKVGAETPVDLKAVNTTVGGALANGLRPLKLEYVIVENQLTVRLAEPSPMKELDVSAKDLADGSEQQLSELAELLQAVVEPASWGSGEQLGNIAINTMINSLTVRNRRAVQAQIWLACEKLRVARGKETQLKLDAAVVKGETRWTKAKPHLETPISLNFARPTRLVTVLDRLGAAGGVRILVDWRDVAAAGWNPAGEGALVADKQPLSAALDALLSPLDLTWRVVDGQTLEVLTPAHLAERVELEFYKVEGMAADDPTGEKMLAKIRAALGEELFRSNGGNCEIRFDPEGKCLLAALPQPKQRELEALLAKWVGEVVK